MKKSLITIVTLLAFTGPTVVRNEGKPAIK